MWKGCSLVPFYVIQPNGGGSKEGLMPNKMVEIVPTANTLGLYYKELNGCIVTTKEKKRKKNEHLFSEFKSW